MSGHHTPVNARKPAASRAGAIPTLRVINSDSNMNNLGREDSNFTSYVKSASLITNTTPSTSKYMTYIREPPSGMMLYRQGMQDGGAGLAGYNNGCVTPPPSPALSAVAAEVVPSPGTGMGSAVIGGSATFRGNSTTAPNSTRFLSSGGHEGLAVLASRSHSAEWSSKPQPPPLLDLVAPFRFASVEDGVYRGAYPVLRNFYFLKERGIKTIISLTPEKPTLDLKSFCEAEGITLKYIQAEKFKEEAQLLPGDIGEALQLILDAGAHPVYIHCLDGKHVTGLVIMALRKLMCWEVNAAHDEYCRFTKESFDEVSFIKDYTGPLTLPVRLPKWLWAYNRAPSEEESMHARFFASNTANLKVNGIKLKYAALKDDAKKEKEASVMRDDLISVRREDSGSSQQPGSGSRGASKSLGNVADSPYLSNFNQAAGASNPLIAPGSGNSVVPGEEMLSDDVSTAALSLPPTSQIMADGVYLNVHDVSPPSHGSSTEVSIRRRRNPLEADSLAATTGGTGTIISQQNPNTATRRAETGEDASISQFINSNKATNASSKGTNADVSFYALRTPANSVWSQLKKLNGDEDAFAYNNSYANYTSYVESGSNRSSNYSHRTSNVHGSIQQDLNHISSHNVDKIETSMDRGNSSSGGGNSGNQNNNGKASERKRAKRRKSL